VILRVSFALGACNEEGRGVKQDFKEALRQYHLAAKTDSPRHKRHSAKSTNLGEASTLITEKPPAGIAVHRPG